MSNLDCCRECLNIGEANFGPSIMLSWFSASFVVEEVSVLDNFDWGK